MAVLRLCLRKLSFSAKWNKKRHIQVYTADAHATVLDANAAGCLLIVSHPHRTLAEGKTRQHAKRQPCIDGHIHPLVQIVLVLRAAELQCARDYDFVPLRVAKRVWKSPNGPYFWGFLC